MIKKGIKHIGFILALLTLATCKVPYGPTPVTTISNYLVVEGFINTGSDSTFIKLSRTLSISSAASVKPELKAQVFVESNTGGSYPLKELGNGNYALAPLNLSPVNQYRLRIKTAAGSTYTSDFAQSKVTPPIDSVITRALPDGLHISVNAHDANNNTRYYRWDYTETWQFTSFFESKWMTNGTGIVVVPRTNDIYHCWGNNVSSVILLASTDKLTQDVLMNSPITIVPSSSEKLSIRYSILIKQYALSKDAYDYWTLLKKNTADLGSVFDSQPSESIGNLHNINNAAEPVIGYVSVSTFSQTRIYLNQNDLPKSYISDYLNSAPYNQYSCGLNVIPVVLRDERRNVIEYPEVEYFIESYPHAVEVPVAVVVPYNPKDSSGSHSGSSPGCVDCTLRGTNVKPSFWQ